MAPIDRYDSMPTPSEIEQAIQLLEAAGKGSALSEDQIHRITTLTVLAEQTHSAVKNTLSAVAENAIFQAYSQQYDRLHESVKERCDWKTIVARLLANGGEKLKKVQDMQGGGELFGFDRAGRAMFKDKGVEPVMYGFDKEDRLMQIYDRDPEQMEGVKKWADYSEIRERVRADGYELFADDGKGNSSDEMQQVYVNIGVPFVASNDRKDWRDSWLESGDKPDLARYAAFCPGDGQVYVHNDAPKCRRGNFGAVRLLRV